MIGFSKTTIFALVAWLIPTVISVVALTHTLGNSDRAYQRATFDIGTLEIQASSTRSRCRDYMAACPPIKSEREFSFLSCEEGIAYCKSVNESLTEQLDKTRAAVTREQTGLSPSDYEKISAQLHNAEVLIRSTERVVEAVWLAVRDKEALNALEAETPK